MDLEQKVDVLQRCTECGEEKPLDDFRTCANGDKYKVCKKCVISKAVRTRLDNSSKRKETLASSNDSNIDAKLVVVQSLLPTVKQYNLAFQFTIPALGVTVTNS